MRLEERVVNRYVPYNIGCRIDTMRQPGVGRQTPPAHSSVRSQQSPVEPQLSPRRRQPDGSGGRQTRCPEVSSSAQLPEQHCASAEQVALLGLQGRGAQKAEAFSCATSCPGSQ